MPLQPFDKSPPFTELELAGTLLSLDVRLGHCIAIGYSLLAGWHLGVVRVTEQNIVALGTSLDMVQSAPTAF